MQGRVKGRTCGTTAVGASLNSLGGRERVGNGVVLSPARITVISAGERERVGNGVVLSPALITVISAGGEGLC